MFCIKCKKEVVLNEAINHKSDGGINIRGTCPLCNTWMKWVAYSDSKIVKDALKVYATLPENQDIIYG